MGYDDGNDVWGLPQQIKGVEFYPIKISDKKLIDLFYKFMCYPKSYINEVEIIKVSYLKYLLYYVSRAMNESYTDFKKELELFLSQVTKSSVLINETSLDFIENPLDSIILNIKINEVGFDEQEFDSIRETVLRQNGISLNYIEEFKPELEQRLIYHNRKTDDVTFEDEIFTFCTLLETTIANPDIKNLTLYQFKKSFQRGMLIFDYKNLYPLEVSGQIKSKEGKEIVKHYLSHIEQKGRYDSILISKDDFLLNNPLMKDNNSNTNKGE